MKHKTYQLLRRAYMGHVDRVALQEAVEYETDPFVERAVRLITKTTSVMVPWNSQVFTSEFRNGNPQERLDETVITFLLRFVTVIKEEFHFRAFGKPESHAAMQAWICLFKQCLFSILTLLYKAEWGPDHAFKLDQLVMDLVYTGKQDALRHFMVNELKIPVTDTITQAERNFEKLNFLTIGQFGSSFWRLLHWMAEAMDMREEQMAKSMWRQLIIESLYRLLRCGICMNHMRKIVQDLKPQLLNETTLYRQLWFNIHNRVSGTKLDRSLSGSLYSESELEEDALFMRQALVE